MIAKLAKTPEAFEANEPICYHQYQEPGNSVGSHPNHFQDHSGKMGQGENEWPVQQCNTCIVSWLILRRIATQEEEECPEGMHAIANSTDGSRSHDGQSAVEVNNKSDSCTCYETPTCLLCKMEPNGSKSSLTAFLVQCRAELRQRANAIDNTHLTTVSEAEQTLWWSEIHGGHESDTWCRRTPLWQLPCRQTYLMIYWQQISFSIKTWICGKA